MADLNLPCDFEAQFELKLDNLLKSKRLKSTREKSTRKQSPKMRTKEKGCGTLMRLGNWLQLARKKAHSG